MDFNNETVRVLAVPAAFRLSPVVSVSLPHLGTMARLEARLADDGILVSWPGEPARLCAWNQDGNTEWRAGDDVTGPLFLRFEKLEPSLANVTLSIASCLASFERDPEKPEKESLAIAQQAIDHLSPNRPWFRLLEERANDFKAGIAVAPNDVEIIERAIQARASLEVLSLRFLDVELGKRLVKLDEHLSAVSSAVLAIPRGQYFELLEDVEPEPGTWWAAWSDLESDLSDEDIFGMDWAKLYAAVETAAINTSSAWFDVAWNILYDRACAAWGMVVTDIQMTVTETDCGGFPVSQDFRTPAGVRFAHWGPGPREMWVVFPDPDLAAGRMILIEDFEPR